MKPFRLMVAALAFLCAVYGVTARAAERPLWEIGVGAGVLDLPYYRGAADNRVLPVPFVYPLYHGKIFKVDEQGVRGLFLKSDRFILDFSADGTVPASKGDVKGREGMPSLGLTFQLGPSVTIDLWDKPRHEQRLLLTLPVRSVFAVNSGLDQIGFASSPKLTYQRNVRFAERFWRVSMTGGIELGSNELHDYFYTVAPRFATPTRPAYNAAGGYAGTRFTLSAVGRLGKSWIGAFVRYDNVSDAVFSDSPLVKKDGNLSAGLVMAWFIAKSKRMVRVPDQDVLRY
ncbi:MAG: MipA/OmpV family protein [Arenicellales bacterium]